MENLQRRAFTALQLYLKKRAVQIDMMPRNLAFYFYASVWWGWTAESNPGENQVASKSLMKLKTHFKQKLQEYYQVRAFYALQDNYEILKGFKDQRSKKLKRETAIKNIFT